jgi:hypothetical protein
VFRVSFGHPNAGFAVKRRKADRCLLFVIVNMMLSGLRFNLSPWTILGSFMTGGIRSPNRE